MGDAMPGIGPSRTTPGLFHVFGFAGHRFQLGPVMGAALTELILDGDDAAADRRLRYRPVRVLATINQTGRLSSFGRLRIPSIKSRHSRILGHRRQAARSRRALVALNSRHWRTMTGRTLVDEVIQ